MPENQMLTDFDINRFIYEAGPAVERFRERPENTYIGTDQEASFIKHLLADALEHACGFTGKVDNSSLSQAIRAATRIFLAHDPYTSEQDINIQQEVRRLVTETLCDTDTSEKLAGQQPGQYVWLVLATLVGISGENNGIAKQLASGYANAELASAAGIGEVPNNRRGGLVREISRGLAVELTHEEALKAVRKLSKEGADTPEVLSELYGAFKHDFPIFREEAIKLGVISALAAAKLNKGSHDHTFEFRYDTEE